MANRVLLGTRGSDKGLFVSRSGQNVATSTEPLAFDSRAAESLIVHSFGQGILVPQVQHLTSGAQLTYTFNSQTYSTVETTITHNLGYVPAFAVRFTHGSDLNNGLANSSLVPFSYTEGNDDYVETDQFEEGDEIEYPQTSASSGMTVSNVTTSSFKLRNTANRQYNNTNGKANSLNATSVYFYSYVIFTAENFTNNTSL